MVKEVKKLYQRHFGRYGYRRITLALRKELDIPVNFKTIAKIMKQIGLKSKIRVKKYKSYKGEIGKAADNILQRDFTADKPNVKWATDITEFKVKGKKLYLSPIIDLFNGEIISYNLSTSPNYRQTLDMLNKGFRKIKNHEKPILHSDQGWQYRLEKYKKKLKDKQIMQSMSRKGNCLDNAIIENFFGVIKSELFYLNEYNSVSQLHSEIRKYIKYYNRDRIRLNLNGMSPVEYRTHYFKNIA